MNNITLITVVIPYYNDSKYLGEAILSVLNQSLPNFNLLLIDDGSTDGSLDIAKSFLYDERVTLFSEGCNKGLIYRLNESIDFVNTKYYVRMDADDIMHRDRLKIQVEIMENNKEIDVLGTNVYSINGDNDIIGVRDLISDSLKCVNSFVHPSIIVKTDWFRMNKYNIKALRFEDIELWSRTEKISNFRQYDIPLLYYREIPGNYYKKYFKSILPELKISIEYLLKYKFIFCFKWLIHAKLQFLKGVIYYVYSLLGKEQLLLNKRNKSISIYEAEVAKGNLLKSVKKNG